MLSNKNDASFYPEGQQHFFLNSVVGLDLRRTKPHHWKLNFSSCNCILKVHWSGCHGDLDYYDDWGVRFVMVLMTLPTLDFIFHPQLHCIHRRYYTVARRYEFYFRVAKQYFTNERSEWVKYCFCNEKIKFISSRHCVMFFLLYRQKDIDKNNNRRKWPKLRHR